MFFATEGEYNHELGGRFNPDANKVGDWTSYGTLKFLTPSLHECSWKDKDFHGSLRGVIGCDADTKDITELMLPEVALSGELPEEIGFLSNLQALDFQNNYLGGMIPDSIGRLSSLRTLNLGHNNFVGTLPSSMGSMTTLQTLYVNYNRMEGQNSIPPSLCSLQTHGELFNVWADCNRLVDPVQCECCTVCCDPISNCLPVETQETTNTDDYATGAYEDDLDDALKSYSKPFS